MKTSLFSALKLGPAGFLFRFALVLQPLSAGLRCSNMQVEETFGRLVVSGLRRSRSVGVHTQGSTPRAQRPHVLLWCFSAWCCFCHAAAWCASATGMAGITSQHVCHSTHAHTGSTSAHAMATVTASAWTFRAQDVRFLSGVKNLI